MSREVEVKENMTPAFVFRRRGIPVGTEVDIRIEGKPWENPGDRLFVGAEYPCFISVKVQTRTNNRYQMTIHKADLYTGRVKMKEKGGMAYA